MIDRKELRKKLPRGYGQVVAKRAGVSERSVSYYFTNKTANSEKIENVVLEVLSELSDKKRKLLNNII